MPPTQKQSIAYSDGDIENHILHLVTQADDVSSDTDIAHEEYGKSIVEYHLSSTRQNCVRHLDFSGLDVLEFGAGMGAISRFLAENARHLTVVEGTERRFSVLSQRLRGLTNWDGVISNYQDYSSDQKYDVVCFCGVLEYAGRFIDQPNPFEWALTHAKSFLREGGAILVLIENKNGFKYFSGSAEDHYGRSYAGICGYSLIPDIKTFSLKEMKELFTKIGLPEIHVHHLWPDYKFTQAMFTDSLVADYPHYCSNCASLYEFPKYHYIDNDQLFPANLGLMSAADSGLLAEFSNSYLFLASSGEQAAARKLLSKIETSDLQASLYTSLDKYKAVTAVVKKAEGLALQKKYIDPNAPAFVEDGATKIFLGAGEETLCVDGRSFLYQLTNHLYYRHEQEFLNTFGRFFDWAFAHFAKPETSVLDGRAFGALIQNVTTDEQGRVVLSAQVGLTLDGDLDKTYFIYRNILAIAPFFRFWRLKRRLSIRGLYDYFCRLYGLKPQLGLDDRLEKKVHSMLSNAPRSRRKKNPLPYKLLAGLVPVKAWRKKIRQLADVGN